MFEKFLDQRKLFRLYILIKILSRTSLKTLSSVFLEITQKVVGFFNFIQIVINLLEKQ